MGILLFLLSCVSLVTYEYPLLKINDIEPIQTITIGDPYQKAQWPGIPTVRVCGATEVPLYRIQQAIHYWEDLGYKFGTVRKDPFSTCMNARMGEIIITLPEVGFSSYHMASTKLYTDTKSGVIVKAKISILPKYARKDRVLEHELGHALGWQHYRKKFHIMHPTWYLGGYESIGVRKR